MLDAKLSQSKIQGPKVEKESAPSQLQTADISDEMVRFANGEVQHYWLEPMSFLRRSDVAETLELQLG